LDTKGFVVHMVGDGELKEQYQKLIIAYQLEKYFVFKGKLF
jgi:hypothetical protein